MADSLDSVTLTKNNSLAEGQNEQSDTEFEPVSLTASDLKTEKLSQGRPSPTKSTGGLFDTPLKKAITVGLLFFVVLCLILIIVAGVNFTNVKKLNQNSATLCVDSACVWESSEILTNLNASADPCENFYEFACGNFPKLHPIPSTLDEITQFTLLQIDNDVRLTDILNEKVTDWSSSSAELKVKDFYTTCQDTYAMTERSGTPLISAINSIGGWQALGTFQNSTWNDGQLNMMLQQLFRSYGVSIFFQFDLLADFWHSGKFASADEYVLYLLPPKLPLKYLFDYLHQDSDFSAQLDMNAYKALISTVIKQLWIDGGISLTNEKQLIENVVNDIITVETALANITENSYTHWINPFKSYYPLRELEQMHPEIEWFTLITSIYTEAHLNYDYIMMVDDVFLTDVMGLISNLTADQINNYAMWNMAFQYLPELGWKYTHAYQTFLFQRDGGNPNASPQQKDTCFNQVKEYFIYAMDRLYIMEHLASSDIEMVLALEHIIKDIMKQRISGYSWMDPYTKINATKKLDNTADLFGYPNWLTSASQVNTFYKNLIIVYGYHFENMVNIYKFQNSIVARRLAKPINRQDWPDAIFNTEYYYDPDYNAVYFPAGMLQHPFFDARIPQFVNFASIGRLIAESMVQSIDPIGAFNDDQGNSALWWSQKDYDYFFNILLPCHEKLYQNATLDGFSVPTFLMGWPDFQALAGTQIVFQAYQQFVALYGAENTLVGLENYSYNQLFYISYAQSFCYNRDDWLSFIFLYIRGSPPENLLLTHILPQDVEFSKTFSCPVGSEMNGKSTCPDF